MEPIDTTYLREFTTTLGRTIFAAIRIYPRDDGTSEPVIYFVGEDGKPTGFFSYCAVTLANRPGGYGSGQKGLCLDVHRDEGINAIQGERLHAYAQGACDTFNAIQENMSC